MNSKNILRISLIAIGSFTVISISEVAFAQSSVFTPVPTWAQQQWESTDDDERAKEQEIETEQLSREGKLKTLPHSKDFAQNKSKPLPPTHLKITVANNMVYLSWGKLKQVNGYIIYDSDDGKTYRKRKYPVKDTKIFVGFVTAIKQKPIHYFGIESLSWGGNSEMIVKSVGPNDIN